MNYGVAHRQHRLRQALPMPDGRTITLFADQSLNAKLAGSGTIRYEGNPPQVTKDVSGSGRMDSPEARAALPAMSRFMWWLAGHSLPLTILFMQVFTLAMRQDPARIRQQTLSRMAPAERAFFEKPGRLEAFMASGMESIRQGVRGLAWDTRLYATPWDFRLEEIAFPVRLLHGEADRNVPVGVARQVAAAIPGCNATFYPGEEHISILLNHLDEVYTALRAGS